MTFNELFEDPDGKQLVQHIINNIEPTGMRSEIAYSTILPIEIVFSIRYSENSNYPKANYVRDIFSKYKEYTDYRLAVIVGDVRRIYIRNPEMIVDKNIVNFLKEFVK